MTNLTKSQIIELRAKAICLKLGYNPDSKPFGEFLWRKYENIAQATIEADEKAGVLMLVEEGLDEVCDICGVGYYLPSGVCDHCNIKYSSVKIGDLVEIDREHIKYGEVRSERDVKLYADKFYVARKIIQRANTPVYQTRKE